MSDEIQERDYESEARAQGWRGQEDWKGDPEDFVDAKEFVKRGEAIMPILRKNNEKLLKELNEAKTAAEEARTVAKEFQKFQKENYERKAKELEEQVKQLRQEKRTAINEGDGDRVVDIDDAIDAIREEQAETRKQMAEAEKEKPAPQQQTVDPEIQSWIERNDWFGKDRRLTRIANALGEAIREENPTITGRDFLDKLDEELATYGKGNTKEVPPNPVEGRTTTRPNNSFGKKRGYNDLPSDAKAACDRFLAQGLIKSKEEYLESYQWD